MYEVYIKLKSQKTNTLTYNSLGAVRCSLSSNFTQSNLGVTMGLLDVVTEPVDTGYYNILCDTTQYSRNLVVTQPNNTQLFSIYLTDMTESLLNIAIPDYECMIIFSPVEKSDSSK